MTILVNKIRCKKCGEEIESTYTHDFRSCKCGACAVDGGHEYLPVSYTHLDVYKRQLVTRSATTAWAVSPQTHHTQSAV